MRSALLGLLTASLLVLSSGCGTTVDLPVKEPEVGIAPVGDVSMVIRRGGSIPVSYLVFVRNRAEIPIQLRTVDLTLAGGAPFTIRQRERFTPRTIPPGGRAEVRIDALLVSRGGRNADREPVQMRARLTFGSDAGSFLIQKLVRIR